MASESIAYSAFGLKNVKYFPTEYLGKEENEASANKEPFIYFY